MQRRQQEKRLTACAVLLVVAFLTGNARIAHAQWYVQAAKLVGIGIGAVLTLWEATSEACALYEGNASKPSGKTLAACRRAGANKNDIQAQLDAIRALPKDERDQALTNYCNWISDSDKRVLIDKLRPAEKSICSG